ncbi:MAG: hypothetical protein AB7I12_14065 [Steroidobacteraceae bacterium]
MLHQFADKALTRTKTWPALATPTLRVAIGILLLIGFGGRLSPLFDIDGRVFWQFMTEDGYLMQTVARNIALGLGMSTADGTLPTNGVQPLATFLFATLHFLADGSKLNGIVLVTAFSTLVAAAAAWSLYCVSAKVLTKIQYGREIAMITAALWFAAPKIIDHSMNGLETGVYYLAILATLQFYLHVTSDERKALSWCERFAFGIILGIVFLARNDAVFFIGALLLAHLVLGGTKAGGGTHHRLTDCLIAGLTSITVGLPWLINNYQLFGSIVPVSGLSESHGIRLGQNLPHIPANLFEAVFLYAPVPSALEISFPVILTSLVAAVAAPLGFWAGVARHDLLARRFLLAGLAFTAGMSVYYGIFFGVGFFLPRYLSALSPFLWLTTIVTAFLALSLACRRIETLRIILTSTVILLAIVAGLFAVTDFARGTRHEHRQVVEWVQAHVPREQWVGAIQTGTLGFFHDRTINLDGKVNPEALRARRTMDHVLDYVVDSRINYLADWADITSWTTRTESARFISAFEVVVKDQQRNLGVLRRVNPVE